MAALDRGQSEQTERIELAGPQTLSVEELVHLGLRAAAHDAVRVLDVGVVGKRGVDIAAAEFMTSTPIDYEGERETRLLALLQEGLHEVPGVTVHGPSVSPDRAPTVVFTVRGRTPEEVDRFLASRRIAVWHGDNYACELVDALGLRESGGLVRAGIEDDVAALLAALAELGPA